MPIIFKRGEEPILPPEPLLVSRKHAAQMLGISLRAIDLLARQGRLTLTRLGGRVLVTNASLHHLATVGSADAIRPTRK